jgi:hypothetical protein
MKDKEIIKKQDELIKHLSRFATFNVSGAEKRDKIISELTALKSESECDHDWVYKILFDHTGINVCTKCKKQQPQSEPIDRFGRFANTSFFPQSEPRETAGKVLSRYPYVVKHNTNCYEANDVIKAMEEYASQSSPDLRREITDEMIEIAANTAYLLHNNPNSEARVLYNHRIEQSRSAFILGAKAYRDGLIK